MTVEVDIRTAAAWIPAGRFVMGDDRFYPEEAPAHAVEVDGFWIDRAPVTNAEFRRFVADTGYVTVAEQVPDPRLYPGVAAEHLVPGSAVFAPLRTPVRLDEVSWWQYRRGACWHAPEGPGSSIEGRLEHPVVHVAYHDAAAYAASAGKRLPTEAEWEKAARGGLVGTRYAWGDEAIVDGDVPANIWHGEFPHASYGIWGTTTVGAFPANGFGLWT
jgi:formylglycine-generating enzyme required for sulfatase activity